MVVTDALEMRAVSATVGVEEGSVRAIAAGADALCFGHDLGDAAVESVAATLVEGVHAGRLEEERLAEAAQRLRETAVWAASQASDVTADRGAARAAARRALQVLGSPQLTRRGLVVDLVTPASIAVGEGPGAGERLHALLPGSELVLLDELERLPECRAEEQLVVVTRDAHRYAWQRRAVESLVARERDAIVVEVGLPHWRPNGDSAFLATYGAGRVNLEAAAETLRG
jgi:beta-N-acetylhexosaminidase